MKNQHFIFRGLTTAMVLFITMLFVGCDRDKFFDESLSLPGDRWDKDEALAFTIPIEDTVTPYRFFINVRNSTSYNYNNIYFFLTTEYPGGGYSQDTIECLLAEKDGSWIGKGTGAYRDNRVHIRDNIVFPRQGKYTLRLLQAMREEILEGISDAGIRLEKQSK
jgi:gliding motility-associated lipoprotein GldH